jgi:hypothetical protein
MKSNIKKMMSIWLNVIKNYIILHNIRKYCLCMQVIKNKNKKNIHITKK